MASYNQSTQSINIYNQPPPINIYNQPPPINISSNLETTLSTLENTLSNLSNNISELSINTNANSNKIDYIVDNIVLNYTTSKSIYIVKQSNITITLPTVNYDTYTNFTIINTSDDVITLTTSNDDFLIYNSNPKNYNGNKLFYLSNNKMAIINNFYNENKDLAWLLVLS